MTLALEFTGAWCCNRHLGNGFDITSFFPGPFYTDEEDANLAKKRKRKSTRGQNRPTVERPLLQRHLRAWRSETHALNYLRTIRLASFICDDESIVKLSKIRSDKITCVSDITKALNKTQEWTMEFGEAVHNVIRAYDFDKDLDGSEAEDEDSDAEEECALEADSNEGLTGEDIEGNGSDEEEEVVPRKRARMANAPSRVPVLVATRAIK